MCGYTAFYLMGIWVCFRFLAIRNNVYANICVHVFVWTFSFLLGIYLGAELLGYMVILC